MKKKTALTLSVLLALTNAAYAKDLTDTAEEHAEVSYKTKDVDVAEAFKDPFGNAVTEQSYYRTGGDVNIIDRDALEKRHFNQLSDALKTVPGVLVRKPGYRGGEMGMENTHSILSINGDDRVIVLVDGRRVDNSASNVLNGWSEDGTKAMVDINQIINVNGIEKIEVIKGPGASIYGSDATGGVINIITKKPEGKKVQGHVTGAVGSYDKNYGVMVGNEHVIFSYRRDYRKPVHQTSRIFFKTPTTTTTRKSREAGTKDSAFLSLRITDKLTATYAYNDTDSTTNEYDYQSALRDWSKLKASRRYHYRQQRVGVTYDDADRQWHSKFAWIRQEVRPMTKDASSDTNSNAYHFDRGRRRGPHRPLRWKGPLPRTDQPRPGPIPPRAVPHRRLHRGPGPVRPRAAGAPPPVPGPHEPPDRTPDERCGDHRENPRLLHHAEVGRRQPS